MKRVVELAFLIHDLIEADQPAEEIAQQVLDLVRTKDISEIVV
jgi:hypothetical protein